MHWVVKSGTRKAGSPDSLQSENPGTREKRKSEREKEGAEHKDEPKNKRGEERANQIVRSQCPNVQGAIYSEDDTSL